MGSGSWCAYPFSPLPLGLRVLVAIMSQMLKAGTEDTRPFQGAGPETLEIMTTMKPFDPRGALLGIYTACGSFRCQTSHVE